jgi:hypothetical protein
MTDFEKAIEPLFSENYNKIKKAVLESRCVNVLSDVKELVHTGFGLYGLSWYDTEMLYNELDSKLYHQSLSHTESSYYFPRYMGYVMCLTNQKNIAPFTGWKHFAKNGGFLIILVI